MNNIEVIFNGTDSLIIRSNDYNDVWDMMRLLNSNQLITLSDVLVSVGLRPNEYDSILSLPANEYYLLPTDIKDFKIVTFKDTSENNGFSYKFIFPEFMPVVFPDIKTEEDA